MAEKKEYEIPEELQQIAREANGATDAMESAVKGFFKYQLRNAVYLGSISRKKWQEFWGGVYTLYPELKGKKCSYAQESDKVTTE